MLCAGPQVRANNERIGAVNDDTDALVDVRARRMADDVIRRRVRAAALIGALTAPFYVFTDRLLGVDQLPLLDAIKLLTLAGAAACTGLLAIPFGRRHPRGIAFGLFAFLACSSAVSASITDTTAAHGILTVAATFFTGALLPWGVRLQLATVAVYGLTTLALAWNVNGDLSGISGYPLVVGIASFAISLWIAREIAANATALARADTERDVALARLTDEAQASAALARIGEELIHSRNRSDLLGRVCELASRHLPCDASWALILDDSGRQLRVAGQHGIPGVDGEAAAFLVLPAADYAPLLERPHRSGNATPAAGPWDDLGRRFGLATCRFAPLWQGDERAAGLLVAG